MPLTSMTLRHNAALQACLQHDPAHVTRGAQGTHVALIHKCLLILEPRTIAANEIRMRTYGPTTAAAVLAYKQKRDIVNRSYQSRADDIVGKMTIARLDKDISKIEQSRTHLVRCGPGGGAASTRAETAVTARAAAAGAGPVVAGPTPIMRNRVLTIHVQKVDAAGLVDAFANDLLARARQLLRPHGLTLLEAPLMAGAPVPWSDRHVQTQFPADRFAVRKSAVAVTPGPNNVLRVILCPFDPVDPIHGITDGGQLPDVQELVPKFVLINTSRRNPDHGTLLHEMVHASFTAESPQHDSDPHSVYSTETARDRLFDQHAARLADAFFARSIR